MKKYVLISVSVLLSMICMYFLCDVKKGKGITYLTDNQIKNIMAYTIDNETVSEMPTKGSGYIAKSITCKNGSVLVWDNDNWKVEVKKLETYDTCNVDFTLDDLVYNFDYNGTNGSDGSVQEFTAPVSGKYVLEVWGAQGGIASSTYIGGYGGYSTGIVSLTKGEKLYIVVGGKGTNNSTLETIPGGYNGGGNGSGSANLVYSSSGGGATHIGKASGLLNTLSNNISDIIIVAGGGGGTSFQTGPYSGNGGSGGGYIGNNGTNTQSDYVYGSGGSQTAGGSSGGGSKVNNEDRGLNGSFGQGGNGQHYSGGGGGGFYGGGASNQAGAGGGSGYIGKSLLSNKVMYCYKCTASSSENIKTISTDNVSSTPISNYAKKENGYARISLTGTNNAQANVVKVITNIDGAVDSSSKTVNVGGTVTFYTIEGLAKVTGCAATIANNKVSILNVNSKQTCNLTFYDTKLISKLLELNPTISERTDFSTAYTNANSATLFKSTEDNATVYYFAGKVQNNWVKFGGYYWRIIRTNHDGSIRLLYHGDSTTATNAYINDAYSFNSSYADPMYVGYMYGTSGSLENNRTNINSSVIKKIVDAWYRNNLSSDYGEFISTTAVYCNDRSNPAGGYNTGSTTFYYGAYTRNVAGKTPTYDCIDKNDKFTVDSSAGNGKLTYPIALMTVDEIAYAGGMYGSNSDVWFYTNSSNTSSTGTLKWWTMSPYYWYSGGYADIFYLFGSDYPGYTSNNNVTNAFAVRPVISLKSNVFWKSGDGSADNPFEIYTE